MENNFTFVEPLTSKSPPKKRMYLMGDDWEPYKSLILVLVYEKRWKLPDVAKYLAEHKGFRATEKQYAYALEVWGSKRPRNIWLSPSQIAHILNQVEERRKRGKDSAFRYSKKRGGEKINFQSMLNYLRKKTPQMQLSSLEDREAIASKLSLGLSSEGVAVYTPTEPSRASTQTIASAIPSEMLGAIVGEENGQSNRSSLNPSSIPAEQRNNLASIEEEGKLLSPNGEEIPLEKEGCIFSVDRGDMPKIQEIDNFLGAYSQSLPTAVVMDASQEPPSLQIYPMPSNILSNETARVSTAADPGSKNLLAAYIDLSKSPSEIIDSISEIYAEMVEVIAKQGGRSIDMKQSSLSDHVEKKLLSAVAKSANFASSPESNLFRGLMILGNLQKGAASMRPPAPLPNVASTPPQYLESDMYSLTESAWMYFFRQDWEYCVQISEQIHNVIHGMATDAQLLPKILNKLRMAFCFEALGAYKRAFEEVQMAIAYAKRLNREDRGPVLVFAKIQEKLLRINVMYNLHAFEAESGVFPVLDEIRSLYLVPGASRIPTRALLYRLQMLGLGWDALDALHDAIQDYTASAPEKERNLHKHPIFCMPLRNSVCWFLKECNSATSSRPSSSETITNNGVYRGYAELAKSFVSAARSEEQLDMHMLSIVQLLGTNLNTTGLPLFSEARTILEGWVGKLLPFRPYLSQVEGVGEDVDRLKEIAIIMNCKEFA